jgi:23S rRNA (cytosine1962-C5)-methyltransferase
MNSQFPRQPSRRPPGKWIEGSQCEAFAREGTNAHRVYSAPEAWLERFGGDLLLSYQTEAARDTILAEWPEWSAAQALAPQRIFAKYLPERNEERAAPTLLTGDPAAPLETVVEENHVRFGLDFASGYSAGLFIDQRANRALVRRGGIRRLLNTFACTCSFSVVAALSGAETVSIDLSRKSLDRGGENFVLNGLDPSKEKGHRFLADDVLDALPRLARKGELFDAIILDPPTFSRGHKGRRFQVEKDFEDLLLAALELAAPRARILLSTNCTRLNRRALENIGRFCLKATRRAADFHSEPALPDIPAEAAARTLWLFLK